MNVTERFEKALFLIQPRDDEGHLLEIDTLIEQVNPEDLDLCFTPIFKYFEAYAEYDFGAPGTLVHFLESGYPRYMPELRKSLERRPSYNSVLMVNRILNSNLESSERQELMSTLTQVQKREEVCGAVRSLATMFVESQRRKTFNTSLDTDPTGRSA